MDSREHTDLANAIRDRINEEWPEHGMNQDRLRVIITVEIYDYRWIEKRKP